MRVLGIDPGTGRLGWAIVDKEANGFKIIEAGCVETPALTPLPERLEIIFNSLDKVIKLHLPQSASIEDLFFAKNQKTIISVGAARGVAILACQINKIQIASFTPMQIKSSLTGYGKADKKQVKFMVSALTHEKNLPKLDDAVDAIAAAITHMHHANVRIKL
jgi:crossover junction endodeoxyribonuclease RuvC